MATAFPAANLYKSRPSASAALRIRPFNSTMQTNAKITNIQEASNNTQKVIETIFATHRSQAAPQKAKQKTKTQNSQKQHHTENLRCSHIIFVPFSVVKNNLAHTLLRTHRYCCTCFLDMLVWSPSGNCITMPKAFPRGIMVALCTGCAPGVFNACFAPRSVAGAGGGGKNSTKPEATKSRGKATQDPNNNKIHPPDTNVRSQAPRRLRRA